MSVENGGTPDFEKIKFNMLKSSYPFVVDGVGFKTEEDARKNVNGTEFKEPKNKQLEK